MSETVVEPTKTSLGEDEVRYDHPAYGMVGASRITTSGRVFLAGSEHGHGSFVELTVSRAHRTRRYSHDRFQDDEVLVKLALSETQWAGLVSTVNFGSGVPCTLTLDGSGYLPGLPSPRTPDYFRDEVSDDLRSARLHLKKLGEVLAARAAKMPKVVRDELQHHVDRAAQELDANLGFVVESFDRHVEASVERGRADVEGHLSAVVQRLGIEAAFERSRLAGAATPELPAPGGGSRAALPGSTSDGPSDPSAPTA